MVKSAIPLFEYFKPQNYKHALQVARKKLAAGTPAEMARNSGCLDYDGNFFTITCLNHIFRVSYPTGLVTYENTHLQPSFALQLMMLNNLSRADGTPLTYNFIAYRHLEGGSAFYDAFYKTAITPISSHFGREPALLTEAAKAFGGIPFAQSTGTAVLLYLLPRVPLLFQLWPGDEEISAQANILFDHTANHYLHTEDLAASDYVSRLLIEQSRKKAIQGCYNFLSENKSCARQDFILLEANINDESVGNKCLGRRLF